MFGLELLAALLVAQAEPAGQCVPRLRLGTRVAFSFPGSAWERTACEAPPRSPEEPPSRLAVIRTPAEFTLTTQDDRAFRLSSLRGKVVLVSFVFTTCNGTCPATTHRMVLAQEALAKAGLLEKVHLLSITLDPARDKPAKLRDYIRLYDIEAKHWTFLTGSQEQIDKVLSDWGMWVRSGSNGQLDHPSRVFLLDGRGRLREIYDLQFFRPRWVREDVQLLLNEVSDASQKRLKSRDASTKRR